MKRRRIRPISEKRARELVVERDLKERLYKKQKGICPRCERPLGWHFTGWHKHEIVRRSVGGDPTDEKNCVLLCAPCHSEVNQNVNPEDKGVWR